MGFNSWWLFRHGRLTILWRRFIFRYGSAHSQGKNSIYYYVRCRTDKAFLTSYDADRLTTVRRGRCSMARSAPPDYIPKQGDPVLLEGVLSRFVVVSVDTVKK